MTGNHRQLLAAAIALTTVLGSSGAAASPWTKSQGQYYAKVGQSVFVGEQAPAATSTVGSNYVGHTTSLYGEFGVAKRVQLTGALPFTAASQEGSDGARHTTVGLADAQLGVQWSPFRVPFALGASTSLPLYTLSGSGPDSPTLGDGQMNQRLTAGYGLAMPKLSAFAAVQVGYQHRSNVYLGPRITDSPDYSDGFVWSAQVGRTFFDLPVISLSLNGVAPFESDDVTKGYLSTGLSAYVPVGERVALEAGAFGTPWAVNSSRGATFTVGVSLRD